MEQVRNFLINRSWTEKDKGMFDFNGLIDLFEEYEEQKSKDFDSVVKLVIKYLCENHHPHTTIIITPTNAELLEGLKSTGEITEFIKD